MLKKNAVLAVLFIIFSLILNRVNAKEWCKPVPEAGKPEFAQCLSLEETATKYMIEVVPVSGIAMSIKGQVTLTIFGTSGKQTTPIQIANPETGILKRVFVESVDIGNPLYVKAKISGNSRWRCQQITIWKDFKYWIFDCFGELNMKNAEATYLLSGNKLYEATIQTGNYEKAGTDGSIEISLKGSLRNTAPKFLKQGLYPGSLKRIPFRAADVGELEEITLKNTAENDPWYCDFIRIKSDGGDLTTFTVKRWIGAPYKEIAIIALKPSQDMELPPQDVECFTRASDIFSRVPQELQTVKVLCPLNCQASEFAHVEGSSIHPASSSICVSAILDGVLTSSGKFVSFQISTFIMLRNKNSGGEIAVSIVGSLPFYTGLNTTTVASVDYEPSADKPISSFFTYRLDSIDNIDKDLRVVDAYGKLSAFGRLEVRRGGTWGTVCKKGDFTEFNLNAAAKACHELGFVHGTFEENGCAYVNGENVCAGKGYPVAVAGIMCQGTEKKFDECTFEEPNESCLSHALDIAIQCTNYPADREPLPGTLRLVDTLGAPSQGGIGRVEYYQNGFGTICSDGWTKESERVACLQMGYTGTKGAGFSHLTCADVMGINYCGSEKQRILLVNVACQGDENALRHCTHETNEDIYCVHNEDVVIGCDGDGDPTGLGLFKDQEELSIPKLKLPPKLTLSCSDRVITKSEMKGPPGTMFLATCPEGCSEEPGVLRGTFIYTDDSPICKAAIHSGAIQGNGGELVIVTGHPQKSFSGSEQKDILSESFGPYLRTYTVSKILPSLNARLIKEGAEYIKRSKGASQNLEISGFPSFRQELPKLSDIPIEKFRWFPTEDWPGFRGHAQDFVDASGLPGGDLISSFQDFSIAIRAAVAGGQGTWRVILAHSECNGFTIAIDDHNELVLQQNCHPNFLNSGFIPKEGEVFHAVITFFHPQRTVSVFINGKKILFETTDFEFHMTSHLEIGRSSDTGTEYFIGEIKSVQIFDYVLSPEQIEALAESSVTTKIPGTSLRSVPVERRTVDGRVCLTTCTPEEPQITEATVPNLPTNPALRLTCETSILTHDFNGVTGSSMLVHCPEQCDSASYALKGCKLYTPDSSVCKAAIHSGALDISGGEAILTLHNGLMKYDASRGSHGIVSTSEIRPQLRSFSISNAPSIKALSCSDDAAFVLKMGIGERKLLHCPNGCSEIDAEVYGTFHYSPVSSVCRAAIHSGFLNNTGGEIEIEAGFERVEFEGSERNGITSQSSGYYLRSFAFASKKQRKGVV